MSLQNRSADRTRPEAEADRRQKQTEKQRIFSRVREIKENMTTRRIGFQPQRNVAQWCHLAADGVSGLFLSLEKKCRQSSWVMLMDLQGDVKSERNASITAPPPVSCTNTTRTQPAHHSFVTLCLNATRIIGHCPLPKVTSETEGIEGAAALGSNTEVENIVFGTCWALLYLLCRSR